MSNSYFRFKQFIIHQDRSGMKVSTDAVLLGALASKEEAKLILDIGTGTGVIALMLAQRYPDAVIEGVEIDEAAFVQATDNSALSPWREKVRLFHQSFQEFAAGQTKSFDLIVSNPPYFPDHIKSENSQRNLALHNDALPFKELIQGVTSLLSREGLFWVILPQRQMQDLEQLASRHGLYPIRKINIFNQPTAPVLRIIQAFSFIPGELAAEDIIVRDKSFNYSMDYQYLLKDFLLAF